MPYIKNGAGLDRVMWKVAYRALWHTQQEVYKAIKLSIDEYYAEYDPLVYKRTDRLLNSLVKPDIVRKGNELYCAVKISDDYLNYAYPYTGKFNPSYPHDTDGRFAMGRDVVNWANRRFPDDIQPGKNHGYTAGTNSEGFWDRGLNELGDIMEILKKHLRKQGVRIVQ